MFPERLFNDAALGIGCLLYTSYFGVIGGTRMLVYKSTPIPYTTSWQLKKMLDWTGALARLVGTSPLWVLAAVGIKLSDRCLLYTSRCV